MTIWAKKLSGLPLQPGCAYLAGLAATDPARVLAAGTGSGITVSHGGGGEIILGIPGVGSRPYEAAVRSGQPYGDDGDNGDGWVTLYKLSLIFL